MNTGAPRELIGDLDTYGIPEYLSWHMINSAPMDVEVGFLPATTAASIWFRDVLT